MDSTEKVTCRCGVEFEVGKVKEVSPSMCYIQQTTCSNKCHNLWILNQGPFRTEGADPVGAGWMPLVVKLNEDLQSLDPNYRIVQIKEKFGELRYYIDRTTSVYPDETFTEEERWAIQSAQNRAWWDIHKYEKESEEVPDHLRQLHKNLTSIREKTEELGDVLVRKAEKASRITCEVCGDPAEIDTSHSWLKALCEKHTKERSESGI